MGSGGDYCWHLMALLKPLWVFGLEDCILFIIMYVTGAGWFPVGYPMQVNLSGTRLADI